MAILKRQWKPFTAVTLVLIAAAGIRAYRGTATGAAVPAAAIFWPYSPPTDVERSQVEELLGKLSLDREALIALNLSQAQAESVLSAVRTFNSDNRSTLDTRLASVATERTDLRNLEAAIRNGTAGQDHQTQWSTAVADLASAQATYNTELNALRTSVNAILSESQQATWTAIQSGWNGPMPLRMLSLSSQQRQDISSAKQRFDHALAEAENDTQRNNAVSDWNTAVENTLTAQQEAIVAAYAQNCSAASANVAAAFETVMPEE